MAIKIIMLMSAIIIFSIPFLMHSAVLSPIRSHEAFIFGGTIHKKSELADAIQKFRSASTIVKVDESNSDTFTLKICNNSRHTAIVAVVSQDLKDESKWILQTWYRFIPEECGVIGRFPRGYFYLFAKEINDKVRWEGKNRFLCLSSRRTRRVIFEKEHCLTGEFKGGFHEAYSDQPEFTWPLGN